MNDMEREKVAAERTLQQIDRICLKHLMGAFNAEEAVKQITEIVGEWTDPKEKAS